MSLQCLRAKVLSVLMILASIPALPAQPKDDDPQHLVEMRTSLGVLVVALYNETPLHRDNFLRLVRDQYYDSLCFHRIIPGFMVQGGDPGSKHAAAGMPLGTGGPDYKIPAEVLPGIYHKKGALAAARQGDQVNPAKESSGSQFYIVQGRTYQAAEMDMMSKRNASMGTPVSYDDEAKRTYATQGGAPHLDGAYTVFGEVIEGLDVLDRIAAVERDQHDRPLVDVRMWMKVLE